VLRLAIICKRHLSLSESLRAFFAIVLAEQLPSEHSTLGAIIRGSLGVLKDEGVGASAFLEEGKQRSKGSGLAVLPAAPRR
jgi:hypothetical protein